MLYRNHIIPPVDHVNRVILLKEHSLNPRHYGVLYRNFATNRSYEETI